MYAGAVASDASREHADITPPGNKEGNAVHTLVATCLHFSNAVKYLRKAEVSDSVLGSGRSASIWAVRAELQGSIKGDSKSLRE